MMGIPVIDPTTTEVIATEPDGTPADVDRAVAAARGALPGWSGLDPADRATPLKALGKLLTEHRDTLAETLVADLGAPRTIAQRVHVDLARTVLDNTVALLAEPDEPERIGNSTVLRRPVGVVGAITPWNYPLFQVAAKVFPALAAGCTVVLKPSEVAPLAVHALARLATEAGLPEGTLTVVSGRGPVVGEALAGNPGVDLVSFTGSTSAGRRVAEVAGRALHKVTLELGGKSACVVLPDADLPRAIRSAVADVMLNSGQTCRACTRLLVPADLRDDVIDLLRAELPAWRVGDPRERGVRLGPLVSAAQRDRVLGYLDDAPADGAEIVAGSATPPDTGLPGYFVAPVVLAAPPTSRVAREEIFGPVLVLHTYRDEDEAVALAADTPYGLGGAVWSGDPERALRVATRLPAGQVDLNGAQFNPQAPFGGVGDSGFGRELGRAGFEEFRRLTAIQHQEDPA